VLAGITIGNYLGGRVADRFPARKALAVLLSVSSVTCVTTVILNNLVDDWILLYYLRWPLRVFTHVFLVFILPSTLLGTISPVVAKMALDQGLPTGRTVGDIYAWGAAGSIAGTFLTGYYLIGTMGTIAIIWTVAAALLAMAIFYWVRFWALYVWAVIFVALMTMAIAPFDWTRNTAAALALRQTLDPDIIYEDETQYCHITVTRVPGPGDIRKFVQDKLLHSHINMNNLLDLQYFYVRVYSAVTEQFSKGKDKLTVLAVGGGGYVFPRYIKRVWPGSRVEVAEIDPGVTEAAIEAFGLEPDTTIKTIQMDARNYVDQLLDRRTRTGEQVRYDFIYEDAFNDYSVPFQLTTEQFNEKISRLLADDGIYLVNLIDVFDDGLFLSAVVNTLDETFDHISVMAEGAVPRSRRNTFVIVASKQPLDTSQVDQLCRKRGIVIWFLDDEDLQILRDKSAGLVLTDDFAPVENLLAPVVCQSGIDILAGKYQELAQRFKQSGKFDQSIGIYQELIKLDPAISITAHTEIANIKIQQGRLREAATAFQNAIEYNEKAKIKANMAGVHLDLALTLKNMGELAKADPHFRKAVNALKTDLAEGFESHETLTKLGVALAELGQLAEATDYLQKAVDMNPSDFQGQLLLARTLVARNRYDEAITALEKALTATSDFRALSELQTYLQLVKTRAK
jgi:tetratricopeptide (TPR) repeat protein